MIVVEEGVRGVVEIEGEVVEVEERDEELLRWFEELSDEFIFEFKSTLIKNLN